MEENKDVESKWKMFGFRLPKEHVEPLFELAKDREMTVAQYLRLHIKNEIEAFKKKR